MKGFVQNYGFSREDGGVGGFDRRGVDRKDDGRADGG